MEHLLELADDGFQLGGAATLGQNLVGEFAVLGWMRMQSSILLRTPDTK
jgi:hypothetical protein